MFIEGKFDTSSSHPDLVLASALNSFFGSLLNKRVENQHSASLKTRIVDVIGSGSHVLFDTLPNLREWIAAENDSFDTATPSATNSNINHKKYMFAALIGAIACQNHPLILWLDDLQCKCILNRHVVFTEFWWCTLMI